MLFRSYFNTDDIPTESNFVDLVDSIPPISYASISVESNATTTTFAGTSADFSSATQVTIFGTNGAYSDSVPDHTNDHITITTAGTYNITASVCFSGGASKTHSMAFFKNNGAAQLGPRTTRKLGTGGDVGAAAVMSGPVSLTAADTVELWVQNETDTTALTVQDACLTLVAVSA